MTDVVGLRFVTQGEQEALNALRAYRQGLARASDIQDKYVSRMNRAMQQEMRGLQHVQNMRRNFEQSHLRETANRIRMMERSASAQENTTTREVSALQRNMAMKTRFEARELQTLGNRIRMMERSASAQENTTTREVSALQRNMTMRERHINAEMQGVGRQIALRKRSADAQARATQREMSAVQRGSAALQHNMRLKQRYIAEQARLAAAGQLATDVTGRLRTQFLATANTIAILDGPLGGIASRFSAFGVLIGRTGLLLAGLAISFTTLLAIAGRGVRRFAEFEVQAAKMNAVLETTRHASGLTGDEIERMSARIALATLETEQGVRQAAMRLLSFRDITGQVFEDVLKAASDMAALGFGTVESEAVKLAKALEDPAQALTSLSRAGIVFTRQQRAMIIAMVESGDRLGAMERILDNVNKRVGGAGEAAARNTFAGDLDTIAQATGRAVRAFGRFIVEVAGVGRLVGGIAASLADYAIPTSPLQEYEQAVRSAEEALRRMREEQQRSAQPFEGPLAGTELAAEAAALMTREQQEQIRLREESLRQAREDLVLAQARAKLQQQVGQVERRREGIENLRAEIDLRQQLIGLTENEQRARRAFAAEGLLGVDIDARLKEYQDALVAARVDWGFISALVAAHRQELEGLADDMERYLASLEREAAARTAISRRDALLQENELLAAQLSLMLQGVEETEARARAEARVTEQRIQQQLAARELSPIERSNLLALQQNFRMNQLINQLLEQRRAAIRQAEDERRATETGQERLDELNRENLVLQAIKDTGEASATVEALRNRQARDALETFIAQHNIVGALADGLRDALRNQQRLTAEARRANEARREAQEREQALDNFNERLRLQREELALLDERLSREQIRRRLDEEAIRQEAERVGLLGEAAEKAVKLFRDLESARGAADFRSEIESTIEGMEAQNRSLQLQLEGLREGLSLQEARRRAEIALQEELIRTRYRLGEINVLEYVRYVLTLRRLAAEREDLMGEIGTFGGGGGGGRVTNIQDTIDQLTTQIERERQLLGLERQRRTEMEIFFRLQDANKDAAIQKTEERLRQIAAEIAANQELLEVEKERIDQMERLAQTIENSMERAFMSIVDGTRSAKDAFKEMARQIIAELFRVLVVQQMVGQIRGMAPGLFNIGTVPRNANGNAFAGGNVIPFARGGVVNRATLFPMAGGQTGMMGEAGPEAIMPLKRGRDGKLGVQAEGMVAPVINLTFHVAANGDESVKRIVAQQVPAIAEATKSAVIDARRRGGQMKAAFR